MVRIFFAMLSNILYFVIRFVYLGLVNIFRYSPERYCVCIYSDIHSLFILIRLIHNNSSDNFENAVVRDLNDSVNCVLIVTWWKYARCLHTYCLFLIWWGVKGRTKCFWTGKIGRSKNKSKRLRPKIWKSVILYGPWFS